MAIERFSHLFLPGPSDTRDDYSNPRRGGSGPRLRPQDRPVHAEYVRRALETAWAQADERRAVAQSSRNGVYLEFASEPGFDLVLKSLESRQAGIKLLNVRIDENDGVETTRATVFIPADKSSHFLKKAIEYATADNPPKKDGTTTPKNGPLIESIGDVRAAILEEAFWQDAHERLPGEAPEWVEAWLSSEDLDVIARFKALCASLEIELGQGQLTFPERTVLLILASRTQLESLIEHSDSLAEFRGSRNVATFYIEQENADQTELVNGLIRRTTVRNPEQTVVLVLDHWQIGEARNVGSIHSDTWSGTAAELALSDLIAVHPAIGWWRERSHLGKYNKETRYSLIVSFTLPGQEIDIYTPVAIRLGVPIPVPITITT